MEERCLLSCSPHCSPCFLPHSRTTSPAMCCLHISDQSEGAPQPGLQPNLLEALSLLRFPLLKGLQLCQTDKNKKTNTHPQSRLNRAWRTHTILHCTERPTGLLPEVLVPKNRQMLALPYPPSAGLPTKPQKPWSQQKSDKKGRFLEASEDF